MKINRDKMTSRDIQAIERCKQILDAAKELFAEKGYNATTTRMLCRQINMADGLIYHYFPEGKYEILKTIVEENLVSKAREIIKLLGEIPTDMPIREALFALGNIFNNNAIKDSSLFVILLRERNNLPEDYIGKLKKVLRGIAVKIIRLLQKAMERKEICVLDYNMMVNQLWGSIEFYLIQRFIFNNENLYGYSPEEYFKVLIEHTLSTWKI